MSDLFRREPQQQPPPGHGHEAGEQPVGPLARVLLAAAIVVSLVLVAGGTTWWFYTQDPVDQSTAHRTAGPCGETELRVVAAPEIAPVVQAAARTLNDGDDCGPVQVVSEEPTVTATTPRQPDVWIPSGSAWLRIALIGGTTAYHVDGEPLARSPIVLAAPDAVAARFAKGDQTSWMDLLAGVTSRRVPAVTMPDPLHSSVGMLAVYALQTAMDKSTPDAGIAQLRALTLRSRLKDATADPATLLATVAAQTDATDVGVFPITEQQLTTYQRGGHAVRLTGTYPADGLIEVDYPYAISTTAHRPDLADRLRSAISVPALTGAGFRPLAMPRTIAVPEQSDKLLAPAAQWAQYRALAFQVLLLIDESSSMNRPATDKTGRSTTKAGLLRQSGLDAARLFGDETSIGVWFFGTPDAASPAHTEAVPFGQITARVGGTTRREALATAIGRYNAPKLAGTPLFQTLLDAHAAMQSRVKPQTITLVIVLSDGTDGESNYAMPKKTFLDRLSRQEDAKRPVPVIAVGFGPDADMATLTAVAKATEGRAIAAKNPADLASALAKAFLAAHTPS
jgi:Ca-activated chloride channel family protein